MTMVLRWWAPPRRRTLAWVGPAGVTEAVQRDPTGVVAAVVGPAGPRGESGSTQILSQSSPAATWTLAHTVGKPPLSQVFLSSGELVIADVVVDSQTVVVTFAQPQSGFVIAS